MQGEHPSFFKGPRRQGEYMPSTEYLRELFTLNPFTGALHWKVQRGSATPGKFAGRWDAKGYLEVRIDGVLYKAHRIVYKWLHGVDPGDLTIDHINGVRDCNRPWNLHLMTRGDNARKGQVSWA